MDRSTINILLFFILVLIVVLSIKDYQLTQLKSYYLFEVSKTDEIYGFVSHSEIYDDKDGGRSYRYIVRYSIRGKSYILNEKSSLFPIQGAYPNDSILVKFVPGRPETATVKNTRTRNIDMLIATLVSIVEITMIVSFLKYLNKWLKNRKS